VAKVLFGDKKTPVRDSEVGKQTKRTVCSSKKSQNKLKEWKNESNLYLTYLVGLEVHFFTDKILQQHNSIVIFLLTKSFSSIIQL